MGASTAAALLRGDPNLDIALASRSRGTYDAAVKKRPELAGTQVVHQAHCMLHGFHSMPKPSPAVLNRSPCPVMQHPYDAVCLQALHSTGEEHATCMQFVAVDINDAASLEAALRGADLVVHTAGPFQRKETCGVLEAALAMRTPYMDVCDDADYSQRAKGYHEAAQAAGVPAITTAGAISASPCLFPPD